MVCNPHGILEVYFFLLGFHRVAAQISVQRLEKMLKVTQLIADRNQPHLWVQSDSRLCDFYHSLCVAMVLQQFGRRKSREFLTNVLILLSNTEDEVPNK